MKKLLLILFLPIIVNAQAYELKNVEGSNDLYLKESVFNEVYDIGYKLESLVYNQEGKCYNIKLTKHIRKGGKIIYSKAAEDYKECLKELNFSELELAKNIVLKEKDYVYIISNNFLKNRVDIIKLKDDKIMYDRSLIVKKNIEVEDAKFTGKNDLMVVGRTNEDNTELIGRGGFDAFLYLTNRETGEVKVIKSVGTNVDDNFLKIIDKNKNGEYYVLGQSEDSYIYRVDGDGTVISKKRFQNTSYRDVENFRDGIIVAGSKDNHPAVISYDKDENIFWRAINNKYDGSFNELIIDKDGIYALGNVKLKRGKKTIIRLLVQKVNKNGEALKYKLLGVSGDKTKLVVDDVVSVISDDKIYVLDKNLKNYTEIKTSNNIIAKNDNIIHTSGGKMNLVKNKFTDYLLIVGVIVTAALIVYVYVKEGLKNKLEETNKKTKKAVKKTSKSEIKKKKVDKKSAAEEKNRSVNNTKNKSKKQSIKKTTKKKASKKKAAKKKKRKKK